MKLKRSDMVQLMAYIDKEKPEVIEVIKEDEGFTAGISFLFKDLEGRDCSVRLYQAQLNIAPDLTKTMKLYSRISGKPSAAKSPDDDT